MSLEPGETATLTFTLSATQSVATGVLLDWSGTASSGRYDVTNRIDIPSGSRTATLSLPHRDVSFATAAFGSVVIRITQTVDNAQVQVGTPSSVTVNLVSPNTPPDPPTNVSVSMSGNVATIKYTPVPGATNHHIHYTRSTTVADDALGSGSTSERLGWHDPSTNSNTGTQEFNDLWTGTTSYPNTTYRFRIRAVSPAGESPWVFFKGTSRSATSSTPGVPEDLSVTLGDGQLTLRWTSDAHASGYDVQYTSAPTTGSNAVANSAAVQTVSAAAGWLAVSHSGTVGLQVITGLTNSTEYRVRLRAKGTTPSAWTFDTGTPAKSSDADLLRLSATSSTSAGGASSPLDFGTFVASTTTYTVTNTVPYARSHVRIRPTVADTGKATVGVRKGASGDFTPVRSSRRTASIALDRGTTTFTIRVTAQDGTTTQDYSISITREDPSTDADLSGLIASTSTSADGTFNSLNIGTFDAATTSYTANVVHDQTHVKLTPTVADTGKATVMVQGNAVPSGTTSSAIALNVGANTLTVRVTAQDGTTTKDYSITITRASSTNADLSGLTASTSTSVDGTYNTLSIGNFSSSTTSYTATVANDQTHVKLTPTVADTGQATVTVQGNTVPSGTTSSAIALNVGTNSLTVRVTAQDGTTTKDYSISITRASSNDANLSALTASTSTSADGTYNTLNIGTFAAGTISYTATVANDQTHVKLTPTVADTGNATVTVQGNDVPSGTASTAIALSVGANSLTIRVTAQDGTTTQDYTITITRETARDANLSGLNVRAGNTSLRVTWTAPSDTPTGYHVHYTSASNSGSNPVSDSATVQTGTASAGWVAVSRTNTDTTTSQTISGLSNGTLYRVRVRAITAHGNGPWAHSTGTPQAADTTTPSVSTLSTWLTIGLYDWQKINKPIPIYFTYSDRIAPEALVAIGFTPETAEDESTDDKELKLVEVVDIDNVAKHKAITVTLTSKAAGKNVSTIGQPQNASLLTDGSERPAGEASYGADITSGSKAYGKIGDNDSSSQARELLVRGSKDNPAYPYWSTAPREGVDSKGADVGTEDKSRLGWLQ